MLMLSLDLLSVFPSVARSRVLARVPGGGSHRTSPSPLPSLCLVSIARLSGPSPAIQHSTGVNTKSHFYHPLHVTLQYQYQRNQVKKFLQLKNL